MLTWKEIGKIMGARGGKQRAANMTKEQRIAAAKYAVSKRKWRTPKGKSDTKGQAKS